MKKWYIVLFGIILLSGAVLAAVLLTPPPEPHDHDTVFQVSTINALLQAEYDGVMTFGDLKKHGDFGISTLDALDGEMIAVDGNFYQIKADGHVYPVSDTMTTPFGAVTWFERDMEVEVRNAGNFSEFTSLADAALPSGNYFYAVRIDGTFPYMKTRSIPAQEKPYPRLVDASAHQSVFEFYNTSGTVAGFYTPEFAGGINIPGWHLHYITDDRTAGGHILDFAVVNTTMYLDISPSFRADLPASESFMNVSLDEDLDEELKHVEQSG
jgi:acetolactate decarboxylase